MLDDSLEATETSRLALYSSVMCVWTITNYVLINNTKEINHRKKVYVDYYSFFGLFASALFIM